MTNLQYTVEQLQKDTLQKNLIIYGISDDIEDEDYDELYTTVSRLIFEITKREIHPDVLFRMGEFRANQSRPIKVTFALQNERDCVFEARTLLDSSFTIKADIPFTMRRDFALLSGKSDELNKAGHKAQVNFRRREILVDGIPAFNIIDGSIQNSTEPQPSTSTASSMIAVSNPPVPIASKNGHGRITTKRKRATYQPNPNLINSGNLRSYAAKFRRTEPINSSQVNPANTHPI